MSKTISNLSENHLCVVLEALEFFSRFLSGQLETGMPDEIRFRVRKSERAREALRILKAEIFPELRPNEAYGIGRTSAKDESIVRKRQISYELYRQIYVFQTARRKAEGCDVSFSVYDSPTLRYSGEPLIEITESSAAPPLS